ncbi:MAG: hypothetical protein JNK02_04555, partial [Planctomycetes bacterium]|nr:hypothetical protein [Planctomycetota bacterium]
TSVDGLQGWRTTRSGALAWSVLDAWSGGRPYAGTAFAINEATVSLVDSALGGGGFDGWRADVPGRMFALVASGGAQDVAPVAKTVSACATRDEEFPLITCQGSGPDTPILADPRPFVLQTGASSAQWLDPYDPLGQTEWFVSGDETSWHALPPVICAPQQPCAWVSDATRCAPSPCPANNPCSSWGRRKIPGASSDVGWLVTRLRTGAAPPGTVRGDQMELAWWQLPANHLNTSERSNTAPYTTSTADPRTIALGPHGVQVPKFLHLVRNGALDGVRIVRTEWVLERARGAAAACPPDQRGNGEPLGTPGAAVQALWGANSDLEMRSVLTHVELAAPGCEPWIAGLDCWTSHDIAESRLRFAWNNKAHVFSVPDPALPEQPRWILAVAAGFVTTATGQNPAPAKNATCAWKDHYRRALTVFYDVTHLDAGLSIEAAANAPLLLAAALGPDPATEPIPPFGAQHGPELVAFDTSRGSHAFALRTKEYPQPGGTARTLAFVADLLGRVLVYDVSWDRLKPAAGSGFTPMPSPGDGSQPLLFPGRIHRFVASPVDGWRPNCTDLEIDEHVLYCATVRDGVQLLEIGPGMPSLSAPPQAPAEGLPVYGVLDTAGMATGLALRRPSALNRQMDQLLVGDNRAGLLVFGRTGN